MCRSHCIQGSVNGETGRIVFVNCKVSELTAGMKTGLTIPAVTNLSLSLSLPLPLTRLVYYLSIDPVDLPKKFVRILKQLNVN